MCTFEVFSQVFVVSLSYSFTRLNILYTYFELKARNVLPDGTSLLETVTAISRLSSASALNFWCLKIYINKHCHVVVQFKS